VLIAPKDSSVKANIQPGFDLAALLKGGRLAMGNVDAVPAGKYGKASLEKLGVWDSVKDKIAQAESVRAALLFVSRGEAPLGIVYQTDAAADPNVKIVGTFPEETHPPIIYPVALTKESTNADAQAFLNSLRSPSARAAFERQGFTVLAPGGQRSYERAHSTVCLQTRYLPAVCAQRRAGNEAGVVGGKKHHAARDLLRLAQPSDRDIRQDILLEHVLRHRLDHFGGDIAGAHRVDGDAALGAFLCQRSREAEFPPPWRRNSLPDRFVPSGR